MAKRAPTVAELLASLKVAIAAGNLERVKQIRQRLIFQRAAGPHRASLRKLAQRAADDIGFALSAGRTDQEVRSILVSLSAQITQWFGDRIHLSAAEHRRAAVADVFDSLSPPQRRGATGFPFDAKGNLKPRPGELPPDIEREQTRLRDILLWVSPLVVLGGDKSAGKRNPIVDALVDRMERGHPVASIVDGQRPRELGAPWRQRIVFHFDQAQRRILGALQRVRDDLRAEFRRRILQPLGLDVQGPPVPGGLVDHVATELRSEQIRTKGAIEGDLTEAFSDDVYLGYTLRSRFLATTAPDHAARDGLRFYRDGRSGSAAPWAQRIIPPYGHPNCVCFTIPILEDSLGDEFDAEFGIRVSRGETISIRDVGTWEQWFARQRPGIQKTVVGERHWFAVQSSGFGGRPTWADFHHPDGRPVSVSDLVSETPLEREARRRRTQIVIDAQHRRFTDAWQHPAYRNRFDSDPRLEAEYRARLDRFLASLGL